MYSENTLVHSKKSKTSQLKHSMWAKNEDFRGGQSYPGGVTLAAQSKNWFVVRSHAIFPFD